MRPTHEIQYDMAASKHRIKEETARFERLQAEFFEALLTERQATPLTAAERALLIRLSHGPIEDGKEGTPSPFTDDESEMLWKLREKLFAHYHAESWHEGTWTITDAGINKLAGL